MVSRRVSAYRALASDKRVSMLHALQRSEAPLGVCELAAAVGLHVNTAREHLERLIDSGFVASAPELRTTRGRPRILYSAVERIAPSTTDGRARDQLMRVLVAGYGRRLPSAAGAAEAAGSVWGRSLTTTCPDRAVQRRHRDTVDVGADPAPAAQSPDVTGPVPPGLGACADDAPPTPVVSSTGLAQLAALEAHFDDLGFEPEGDAERLEVHLHRCPFLDLARERPEVVCSVHLGLARGVLAQEGGPLVAERLEPFVEPQHCVLYLSRS
ncbi:MAG: helix-turn-helix transcriptional regulator [Cellulomonas sp.]